MVALGIAHRDGATARRGGMRHFPFAGEGRAARNNPGEAMRADERGDAAEVHLRPVLREEGRRKVTAIYGCVRTQTTAWWGRPESGSVPLLAAA